MPAYNVYYVELTERRTIVAAKNKTEARAKAKKKMGKVKIVEVQIKNK
jgi:hypothetical protein